MNRGKKIIVSLTIICLVSISLFVLSATKLLVANNDSQRSDLQKIGGRFQLEQEGKLLFRQGQYKEALEKFQAADAAQFQIDGRPNGVARYRMREAYVMLGQYEKALKNLETVSAIAPDHDKYLDEKAEYQALILYRDEHSTEPVYEVIENIKKKYAEILPPQGFEPVASLRPVSTILRLYDTIADCDAGIAYIDEILTFLKERRKERGENYDIYDRIKTVEQAEECMKVGPEDNPDWHGCKFLREYYLVREAFEQDKAEGKKGRATQAIIQSDYFPW